MNLETRAVRELELREKDENLPTGIVGRLRGYAAMFNRDSEEFDGWEKPWVERVAPGAFTRTLGEKDDQVALHSHDTARPLAKRGKGLTIEEDERGLAVEIDLPDTTDGRDLMAQVRNGLIDSMSFGFRVKDEKVERGETRDIRTLLDVDLHEVSAVLFPAYPDTSLAMRSLEAAKDNVDDPPKTFHRREAWKRRVGLL